MKYIKLISLWAMAMVAVPAFAATVGEGSTITAPGADGKPVVVAAGQKVPENATISTEEGKEASIVLENGSVVVVSAGAIVKVNGNNVEVIGGVVVDVVATVVVRTPQGSVSCSEGTVGISASPAETKVTSVKGTWRVESSSGSVKALGQGQTIVLKADGSSQVRNATASEVAGVSAVQNTAVPAAKGETPASAPAAAAPAEPSTTPEIPGSDSSADTPISGSDA